MPTNWPFELPVYKNCYIRCAERKLYIFKRIKYEYFHFHALKKILLLLTSVGRRIS